MNEIHFSRTLVTTLRKTSYEVVTNIISRINFGPTPHPRYDFDTTRYNYETVIYAAKPISKVSDLEVKDLDRLTYEGTNLMRDVVGTDLYRRLSSTEDDAATAHEEAVRSFETGDIVLIPYIERLRMFGVKEL